MREKATLEGVAERARENSPVDCFPSTEETRSPIMRKQKWLVEIMAPSLLIFLFFASGALAASLQTRKGNLANSIMRGKYLADIIGCGDCHTPWRSDPRTHEPVPETDKLLSGAPADTAQPQGDPPQHDFIFALYSKTFKGEWGTSFAANLTPDKETGIGNWTFQDFKRAIRQGKYKSQWSHRGDGRQIMPPMPWEDFAHMTNQDLRDLYNYLMSIPPVKNKVPEYIPPTAK